MAAPTYSNTAVTEFDSMVTAEYQIQANKLRGTFYTKENVIGDTVQFPKIGSIESYPAGLQQSVVLQDAGFSKVTQTMTKYMTPTGADRTAEFMNNFEVRRELAKIVGYAMGRRDLQVHLEALINSGTTNTIANGGTNFTYAKILEVNEIFDDLSVPEGMRHIAVSANGAQALMNIAQLTSNDYVNKGAVARGTFDGSMVMGLNVHVIPTMTSTIAADGTNGGLPKSGNIRTCYAWHTNAVGMAYGFIQSAVDWLPEKYTWLVNGVMYMCSKAIQADGIITIDIDETA